MAVPILKVFNEVYEGDGSIHDVLSRNMTGKLCLQKKMFVSQSFFHHISGKAGTRHINLHSRICSHLGMFRNK